MIDRLQGVADTGFFAAALGEIRAGAEAAAFAGQDHGAKSVLLFLDEVERSRCATHQFRAGGVHCLGMIERQNSNVAVCRDIGPIEIRTHARLLLVVTREHTGFEGDGKSAGLMRRRRSGFWLTTSATLGRPKSIR